MRRPTALILIAALFNATACYSYLPLPTSTAPKVGERVRVALTPDGTTELARYLGPRVTMAEGGLASVAGDGALTIAVDFVQTSDGIRQPWSGEGAVTFPPAYMTNLQQRTYLPRQSLVAGVALTAGLVGLTVIALKAGGARGSDGTGGGGPPP